jgi:hypothetical protein
MTPDSHLRRTPESAFYAILIILLFCCGSALAQKNPRHENPAPAADANPDISGMYSFLKEGEFVQITVENDPAGKTPRVTGFVSRYGEGESDKGEFLDHFFTKASLAGNKIDFATKQIHGVSFEFSGTVARGAAKSRAEEGYYIVTGTLTENTAVSGGKNSSRTREISMKLFPDMDESANAQKR